MNTHASSLWNFCRLSFLEFEECLNRSFIHWNIYYLIVYQNSCSENFTDHLNSIWYRLQVTEATNGFTFQIIHSWSWSCPGFTGGLTVIPPLETCELFWANLAFTTLFSSLNTVLQLKYKLYQYDICPLQKKTQQRINNRTFYKYKKSERDFLIRAISKIPYRRRNAACLPSYTPCIFLTDITNRSDKNAKICQLIGLVFDTIYERRNPTTTTWPVASKMESKKKRWNLLRFSQTCEL